MRSACAHLHKQHCVDDCKHVGMHLSRNPPSVSACVLYSTAAWASSIPSCRTCATFTLAPSRSDRKVSLSMCACRKADFSRTLSTSYRATCCSNDNRSALAMSNCFETSASYRPRNTASYLLASTSCSLYATCAAIRIVRLATSAKSAATCAPSSMSALLHT